MPARPIHRLVLLIPILAGACDNPPLEDDHGLAAPDTIIEDSVPLLDVPAPLEERQP